MVEVGSPIRMVRVELIIWLNLSLGRLFEGRAQGSSKLLESVVPNELDDIGRVPACLVAEQWLELVARAATAEARTRGVR